MLTDAARSEQRAAASPVHACPVSPLIDVVFSRWTTPILWTLQVHGPQRFNELRRRLDQVTGKVLTQRLRQLERDGLVDRVHQPQVPPKSTYSITPLGLSLSPAFRVLAEWTGTHMHEVDTAREQYDEAGKPRSA